MGSQCVCGWTLDLFQVSIADSVQERLQRMRLSGEPLADAEDIFGEAEETEFTFLLVPVSVYELTYQVAKDQGISVGSLFQKALLQYLRGAVGVDETPQPPQPSIQPDFVVKKRR